ncbi:shikimate kinase [Apibacter raozihei]|uniref:shikimate kinase n=1 Tax=Apibacter raozihei TaxID=2500547 RepID=UPI000FE39DF3|nr:shikimate kinase [Apibacter raozihei]
MIISLTGYMGSGKSTIGKSLSKITNLKFIDLDEYVIFRENMSVKDIFSKKGEIYFRKAEHLYLKELLSQDNFILSLGGGTPAYHNNMDLINDKSISFYLKMTPVELAERLIKEKNHRPLIAHLNEENIKEFIAKHLFERSVFYEKAIHKINNNNKSVSEICTEILDLLS